MPEIVHSYVSPKSDGSDSTKVRASNWNAPMEYAANDGSPSGTAALVRLVPDTGIYYIRTDGNDATADGSANDSAHAFATISGALGYILPYVDVLAGSVILQLAPGTYDGAITINQPLPGGRFLAILGDVANPGNVILDNTADSSPTIVSYYTGTYFQLEGVTIKATGGGYGIRVADGSNAELGTNVYGACGDAHISGGPGGGHIYIYADYTISGAAASHIYMQGNSSIEFYGNTVTISGSPAFSSGFARSASGSIIQSSGMTYGTATGPRFNISGGGAIQTFGSGLNYFAGNATGTQAGGWYDGVEYSPPYAKASLPGVAVAGGMIYVTNETGGAVLAFSDGTNWRRVTDRAIVA